MLPPRWARRVLFQPLFVVVTVLLTVLSPVLLLLAALASPLVAGRWRPLRAGTFTLLWMQRETVTIAYCAILWVTALGRVDTPAERQRTYKVMRWFLHSAVVWGRRLLGVTVRVDDDGLAEKVLLAHDRPLLCFSRHSGPGDTFYLVDLLLDRYAREPRIVMKEMLKIDPCIDLAGTRVPNYFVPPPARRRDGAWSQAITELAAGMDGQGALLLFPEGGNFSPERRARRLRRLWRRGRRRDAERAGHMQNVIAPEPGGALTAVAAAPEASVILVAHCGLGGLEGSLLSRAPMDQEFRVHLWYIDAADIPRGEEPQRQWLLDCWQRIDDWISVECEAADRAGDHGAEVALVLEQPAGG